MIKLYVSLTFKWYCIRYRRGHSKIGPKTFMCTPENVDIVGAISELFGEEEDTNIKRW